MILYGAFGNVSIGALFLGGIVPGLIIGLGQMAYTYVLAVRHGFPAKPRTPMVETFGITLRALPPLLLPVIVLGGITGGGLHRHRGRRRRGRLWVVPVRSWSTAMSGWPICRRC